MRMRLSELEHLLVRVCVGSLSGLSSLSDLVSSVVFGPKIFLLLRLEQASYLLAGTSIKDDDPVRTYIHKHSFEVIN